VVPITDSALPSRGLQFGERLKRPDFGCNLKTLVFVRNIPFLEVFLTCRVLEFQEEKEARGGFKRIHG
jgi:hypothetical protein